MSEIGSHAAARRWVHVIDDDSDLRESLALALHSQGYATETHESVERFFQNYLPVVPSVILVDMRMPVQSGLDLLRRARERGISSPVIFISGESTAPEAVEALKSGAADFIFKPASLAEIIGAVESALQRHTAEAKDAQAGQRFLARYGTLTPRERDLCPYVARDEKIKKIAAALSISQPTVKIHKFRVMKKLGVATPAELALKLARYAPNPAEPKELNN
jgi:FixJ family two-component response regulator